LIPLEVVTVCTNKWKQNCHILVDTQRGSCLVVDPGYGAEDICQAIKTRNLKVEAVIATHTHFDHVASISNIQEAFDNPPVYFHGDDVALLKTAHIYALFLNAGKMKIPTTYSTIAEGETIPFGSDQVEVMHVPGHTPGGVVFRVRDMIFTGDLLLKVDDVLKRLPGHDPVLLKASVERVFSSFPQETLVFPGHGRATTLGSLWEIRKEFLSA